MNNTISCNSYIINILMAGMLFLISCGKEYDNLASQDQIESKIVIEGKNEIAQYIINNLNSYTNDFKVISKNIGTPDWDNVFVTGFDIDEQWLIPISNNGNINNILLYKVPTVSNQELTAVIVNAELIKQTTYPLKFNYQQIFNSLKMKGVAIDEETIVQLNKMQAEPVLIKQEDISIAPASMLKGGEGPVFDVYYQVERGSIGERFYGACALDLSSQKLYSYLESCIGYQRMANSYPLISPHSSLGQKQASIVFECYGDIYSSEEYDDILQSFMATFKRHLQGAYNRCLNGKHSALGFSWFYVLRSPGNCKNRIHWVSNHPDYKEGDDVYWTRAYEPGGGGWQIGKDPKRDNEDEECEEEEFMTLAKLFGKYGAGFIADEHTQKLFPDFSFNQDEAIHASIGGIVFAIVGIAVKGSTAFTFALPAIAGGQRIIVDIKSHNYLSGPRGGIYCFNISAPGAIPKAIMFDAIDGSTIGWHHTTFDTAPTLPYHIYRQMLSELNEIRQ